MMLRRISSSTRREGGQDDQLDVGHVATSPSLNSWIAAPVHKPPRYRGPAQLLR